MGYDINCVPFSSLSERQKKELIEAIYHNVPSGVGRGQKGQRQLCQKEYVDLLTRGASLAVEQGYGVKEDLEKIESRGCIAGADPQSISSLAMERGKDQLGTIGSGNHFVEIGEVQTLFNPQVAAAWGMEAGQSYILIHSGSRGLGHQVCQDTIDEFIHKGFDRGLPDRQLVCAPLSSCEGKRYFAAMAAAANFAFNNRQKNLVRS